MFYHFVRLTNHLFFFMIGLVLDSLDRVVSNIGPDRLGLVHFQYEVIKFKLDQ